MGRLEVQGIVSVKDGLPRVQFRQIHDDGTIEVEWQSEIIEAREMAQQILEAAFNAIYDASIVSWAREMSPTEEEAENIIANLLPAIRNHRADHWGLPDQPEDWRQ